MPKSKPEDDDKKWISILSLMNDKEATEPLLDPALPPSKDFVYPIASFPSMEKFDVSLQVPALIIPAKCTNELRKRLKAIMIQRPRLKVVVEVHENANEVLPQDESNTSLTPQQCRKLVLDPQNLKERAEDHPLLQPLLSSNQATLSQHTLQLHYADWTADELLKRLLPSSMETPSAFEVVGTLAHLNLRQEQLPYKYLIGKILLDKQQPALQTMVNKLGSIDTTFRTFGMEVIAGYDGEGWSEVQVKEEGCLYHMDFQKVYWNSRLGGEHRRLVQVIRQDVQEQQRQIVVADWMAGIGPFAVPLTSAKVKANQKLKNEIVESPIVVHANDLNPASYMYLKINHQTNHCGKALHMHNMDARAFCHQLQVEGTRVDHVIMNLPASALEFLDAFRGYKVAKQDGHDNSNQLDHMPTIHVYCFAPKNKEEARNSIYARAEKALGCSLKDTTTLSIHEVRDVSPNKNMYCVTFRLPIAVQELPRVDTSSLEIKANEGTEPEQKRQRVDY